MALFGLLGGGEEDDPYKDILTPAQRNAMQAQGLLAMAGAFARAGMPSRLPIPFGAALGSAAEALGAGQEKGMTAALANVYRAQQIRDLRAKAEEQALVRPILRQFYKDLDAWEKGGGVGPRPTPPAVPAGSAPGAPVAAGPLMMDLPYSQGLLGGDTADQPTPEAGSLGGAPSEQRAAAATPQRQAAIPLTGPIPGYPSLRPGAAGEADRAYIRAHPIAASGGGPLGAGSGGGSDAADLAAGGDTPWGPTWSQGTAPNVARGETPEIAQLIEKAAAQYNVPPAVLRGLISVESGFKPNIVSPAGAVGLAQLMPGTARGLGVTDPTDPTQAVPAGARYLRQGLDASGGDINQALMYYHGGPDQRIWGPRTQAYPGAVLAASQRLAGPDEFIPSGSRPNLPIMQAQYAPQGDISAGWGPNWSQPAPLAPPSSLPALPAPGAAPPLGAGGVIPGLGVTPQKLAIIDAMAEAAGLGNPFKGLIDTYYKSPGYLEESAGATARGRIREEEPSQLRVQAAKALADFKQQLAKDALTVDDKNNIVEIPGMREMLGKTAGEIEAAKQRAQAQFQTVDATVVGPEGQPTTEKMTAYEFSYRRQQAAARAAMKAPPQPGDIIGTPLLNPGQTTSQQQGATIGWKAIEDTHAAEMAAVKSDQTLGQIAEAMKGFTPGATAEWRLKGGQILKDLGFRVDGVSDGEIMQQAIRRVQLAGAAVRQGSVSNYERTLYAEGYEQLTNSPEGLAKAIAIGQRLNAYDRQVAAIHRDAMQNGVPNVVEAQRKIAALGSPLSPGEVSALEQIRAGKVPRPEGTASPNESAAPKPIVTPYGTIRPVQ